MLMRTRQTQRSMLRRNRRRDRQGALARAGATRERDESQCGGLEKKRGRAGHVRPKSREETPKEGMRPTTQSLASPSI